MSNFWVRISFGEGGSSMSRGGGQRVRYVPWSRGKQPFGGISWDFCRDIPETPEKFEKKSLYSILVPKC